MHHLTPFLASCRGHLLKYCAPARRHAGSRTLHGFPFYTVAIRQRPATTPPIYHDVRATFIADRRRPRKAIIRFRIKGSQQHADRHSEKYREKPWFREIARNNMQSAHAIGEHSINRQ